MSLEVWLASSEMMKWIAAVAVLLAGLGALLWQLSDDGSQPVIIARTSFDAAPPRAKPDAAPWTRRRTAPSTDARVAAPSEARIDPMGEEFSHRLDVGIPDRFKSTMARCEREGMDPDAKITLSYDLHIESGVVSASNVQIEKSDLNNRELELCIITAVRQKRWQSADMPDFTEEQELFVRMRSLNKYLSQEEQEDAKARDHIGSDDEFESSDLDP